MATQSPSTRPVRSLVSARRATFEGSSVPFQQPIARRTTSARVSTSSLSGTSHNFDDSKNSKIGAPRNEFQLEISKIRQARRVSGILHAHRNISSSTDSSSSPFTTSITSPAIQPFATSPIHKVIHKDPIINTYLKAYPQHQKVTHCETLGFHLFSQLPPELRYQIWNLALPRSRVIPMAMQVRYRLLNDRNAGSSNQYRRLHRIYTPTKPPVILWVNSESRTIAMETYGLHFSTNDFPARSYVDLRSDVLFFCKFGQLWRYVDLILQNLTPSLGQVITTIAVHESMTGPASLSRLITLVEGVFPSVTHLKVIKSNSMEPSHGLPNDELSAHNGRMIEVKSAFAVGLRA